MKRDREKLQQQLENYQKKLSEIESFIKELKGMADTHGTDHDLFFYDLFEAQHNSEYYAGEIADLKREIAIAKESD